LVIYVTPSLIKGEANRRDRMEKISQETIDAVNSYPPTATNRQIGRELRIEHHTVGRYRIVKPVEWPRFRPSQELIDRINTYPETVTNVDIAREIGLYEDTVSKYRIIKSRPLPPWEESVAVTRKLTEEQVLQARSYGEDAGHDVEFAELWGVHRNTVSKARRRLRYRHIE
jgi:hypothetical protein